MPPPCFRPLLLATADPALRSLLEEQAGVHGFSVPETVSAGEAALVRLTGTAFAGLVVDGLLTDMAGSDLCRRLRAAGHRLPVLLLPAEGEEVGPECGADACLPRPWRLGTLLARLRALLEQGGLPSLGAYRFDAAQKLLLDTEGARRIRLTGKEARLLETLLRAAGEVVGREDLLQEVWGYGSQITTNTLETHIYRLRRKIEPDPARATLLLSAAGGYRLMV